jgi:hypothetical protein
MTSSNTNDQMAQTCPETDESIRQRCNYCEQKAMHNCSICHSALYCSRDCQMSDWNDHQLLCSGMSDFIEDKRPSPSHFRAILFPVLEKLPRFIWIKQSNKHNIFFPEIDTWFPSQSLYANMLTDMNALLVEAGHDAAGHGLAMLGLHERPQGPIRGNTSILSLGKPGYMRSWFGHQIIVGQKPNAVGTQGFTLDDANFRDFRHAVDVYQHHSLNLCVVNPERFKLPAIPGVLSK